MKLKELSEAGSGLPDIVGEEDLQKVLIDDIAAYIESYFHDYDVDDGHDPRVIEYYGNLTESNRAKLYAQAAIEVAQSIHPSVLKARRSMVAYKRQRGE